MENGYEQAVKAVLRQGDFKGQSARLRVGMSSVSSMTVLGEERRSPAVMSSSPQHETTH